MPSSTLMKPRSTRSSQSQRSGLASVSLARSNVNPLTRFLAIAYRLRLELRGRAALKTSPPAHPEPRSPAARFDSVLSKSHRHRRPRAQVACLSGKALLDRLTEHRAARETLH